MTTAADHFQDHWTEWLELWLESLSTKAPRTRSGYVLDVGTFGEVLAEVKASANTADVAARESVAASATYLALGVRLRVPASALERCWRASDRLQVGDLRGALVARALHRLGGELSVASVRRVASSVSSFSRYLVGQEALASNPMDSPAVELPKSRTPQITPLSTEELERLFTVASVPDPKARDAWPARDLAMVAFLASTGLREDELVRTRIADMDRGEGGSRLMVLGKGSKPRTVPLHAEVLEVVDAYLGERTQRLGAWGSADVLFVRSGGARYNASALYRLVGRLFVRAGIARRPGAMVHVLRHSFATHALDSGATATEVMRLVGHSSLESTRRYLDVVGEGLADAIGAHPTRELLSRQQANGLQGRGGGPG
jgi:site-specific recombinase XerD